MVDKLHLFRATLRLWPSSISTDGARQELLERYRAIEEAITPEDDWQQLAAWALHQALWVKVAALAEQGVASLKIDDELWGDFDEKMTINLEDESWSEKRAEYALANEPVFER